MLSNVILLKVTPSVIWIQPFIYIYIYTHTKTYVITTILIYFIENVKLVCTFILYKLRLDQRGYVINVRATHVHGPPPPHHFNFYFYYNNICIF